MQLSKVFKILFFIFLFFLLKTVFAVGEDSQIKIISRQEW
jgi:hypothetical protein